LADVVLSKAWTQTPNWLFNDWNLPVIKGVFKCLEVELRTCLGSVMVDKT